MKKRDLITFSTMEDGKRKDVRWVCPKCGMERSCKFTHKHGVSIGEPIWSIY